MSDVSIALLGSGFVAEFYMQGLANVPGHKVVANYSQGEARAQQFARRWSIAEPTTDLKKLIGRRDIDLYIIALPNQVHLTVSLELSRAGKNQVCTKPLGRILDTRCIPLSMPPAPNGAEYPIPNEQALLRFRELLTAWRAKLLVEGWEPAAMDKPAADIWDVLGSGVRI